MRPRFLLAGLLFLFTTQWGTAQIPRTMSYQGVLSDASGNAVSGNRSFTFNLYEQAENGETIWQEIQDVEVVDGLFSVVLGSNNPLTLAFDRPYWLGITVGQEPELGPRIPLTASAYSLKASDIEEGKVVRSINSMKDDVVLKAGDNVSITENGDTLTIHTSTSTVDEPVPGQGFTIRDEGGSPSHVFSPDGDATHSGTGSFAGGLRVASPDTAIMIQGSSEGPALFIISPDTSAETTLAKSKGNAVQSTLVVNELVRVRAGKEVAVYGESNSDAGVVGSSKRGIGVHGISDDNSGVVGNSTTSSGVFGRSVDGVGVVGISTAQPGVTGNSQFDFGGSFVSVNAIGVFAKGPKYAGSFEGKVRITDLPATDEDRVVVWAEDNILKYKTIDNVSWQEDDQTGEISTGNPVTVNNRVYSTLFSVTDANGNPQTELNVTGIRFADGTTQTSAAGPSGWVENTSDNLVTTTRQVVVENEIFARSLHIVDSFGDTLTSFFEDGTSEHYGFESFFEGASVGSTFDFFNPSLFFAFLLGKIAGADAYLSGDLIFTNPSRSQVQGISALNEVGLCVSYLEPLVSNKTGLQVQLGPSIGSAIVGMKRFPMTNQNITAENAPVLGIPEDVLRSLVLPELQAGLNKVTSALQHSPVIEAFTELDDGAGVLGLIDNPDNIDPAVWGSNSGGGAGVLGQVSNENSASPAVWASTSGAGPSLLVDHGGSSGDLATFRSDGTNQARIDKTGKGFFNGGTQTGGADIAEVFEVEEDYGYEPGDVIAISTHSDRKVIRSGEAYSPLVIGVYATKPGVLLTERPIDDNLEDTIPVGVVGVIPTKVSGENGPIRRGDMLVASNTPGHAMKGTDRDKMMGATIGKALAEFQASGTGVIRVLVNVR